MAQPVQNRPAAAQNYPAQQQYRPPVANGGAAVQRPAATNGAQPVQAAPAEPNKTSAAEAAMVGMLVCTKGGDMGENFALKSGKNTVGVSSGCDIVIKDSALTADHGFEIVYDEQRKHFSLVPGKNASELFLNNEPVDAAVLMRAHDTVRAGQSEFLLVII